MMAGSRSVMAMSHDNSMTGCLDDMRICAYLCDMPSREIHYMATDKLLAWVEQSDDKAFLAAFVAADARHREPAAQLCSSHDEARGWIETQAMALDAPVEWVAAAPRE
jgi:hypothetical protein